MKTPQELLAALMGEETAETAVIIYKEAGSYASAYKDVQQAALADLTAGGEARRRTMLRLRSAQALWQLWLDKTQEP